MARGRIACAVSAKVLLSLIRQHAPLPPDVTLQHATFDGATRDLTLYLESDTYPPEPEGSVPPPGAADGSR